ncbi:hypothetical protein ZHAS_00005448 [Anopheles sinensis]|uniref:Uncharacterized protein n=1 Tax=Anopheles sinensis TaxID=74873 RepID=A0A084VJL0_ANOSI|nr:hypothetical protein ZHAS_00005448 [Anopheles sinensis]
MQQIPKSDHNNNGFSRGIGYFGPAATASLPNYRPISIRAPAPESVRSDYTNQTDRSNSTQRASNTSRGNRCRRRCRRRGVCIARTVRAEEVRRCCIPRTFRVCCVVVSFHPTSVTILLGRISFLFLMFAPSLPQLLAHQGLGGLVGG